MVKSDLDFIKKCLLANFIQSPCLELGVGYGGETCKKLIEGSGLVYFGTNMMPGPDVDFVADFEKTSSIEDVFITKNKSFKSVLVLNVLEHVFEPIKVLDNIFTILDDNGICIIITPCIWPLHSYPYDHWRINPNFYEEYCKRRSLLLMYEYFEYIGKGTIFKISGNSRNYAYPTPSQGIFQTLKSRIIHKVFNTYGRGMFFPSHAAIGAVIQKR